MMSVALTQKIPGKGRDINTKMLLFQCSEWIHMNTNVLGKQKFHFLLN